MSKKSWKYHLSWLPKIQRCTDQSIEAVLSQQANRTQSVHSAINTRTNNWSFIKVPWNCNRKRAVSSVMHVWISTCRINQDLYLIPYTTVKGCWSFCMADLFLALRGAFALISRLAGPFCSFTRLWDFPFPLLPLHHSLSVVWLIFAILPAVTTILTNRSKPQSTEIATIYNINNLHSVDNSQRN